MACLCAPAIVRGYDSWRITFYSFLVCTLGCAVLSDWRTITAVLLPDAGLIGWSAAMALFTGFLAYIFYTKGLEGMPSSRASMLASIEPVTATLLGTLLFHAPIGWTGVARYRTGPDCDHCAQRSPVKRRTEIKTSSLFCASSLPEVDHPAAPRCCGADDRKSADASTLWVTSALLFCRRVKNWLGYVHPVHPASFPDSHFPQWLPPARWPYHTWIGRWPAR